MTAVDNEQIYSPWNNKKKIDDSNDDIDNDKEMSNEKDNDSDIVCYVDRFVSADNDINKDSNDDFNLWKLYFRGWECWW